ncbi:MAG TPA: diacylglycerol kinase family protein [Candidatus Paceibacterota bacterium]|nr:diacylglycerol kinase family protein [Candidatus Paceibacterota bacterium]
MRYFFDFDRTVFNTPAFKKDFARHPSLRELLAQAKAIVLEVFDPNKKTSLRRIVTRTLGTYASHRRFGFTPLELKEYLYPDAVEFFSKYGKDCVIVTYGVQAFITAKVANALSDFSLADVVYTSRKKGRTIKRLTKGHQGPFVFVDDAHFQLESVSKVCPDVEVIEIRRDGNPGDGRWPVIRSFDELPEHAVPADINLSTAKIAVVINTASGSYDPKAEEKIRAMLSEVGAREPRVWAGDGTIMDSAFKEVSSYAPDILIVLGGDGTIRAAAEACTSKGPLLVPLPGGTMNMLPKALYGTCTWDTALKDTLAAPRTQTVSGGVVEGRQFFIAAIAGAPTLWAHAREALREGDIGAAMQKGVHAFQNMLSLQVEYSFSKQPKASAEAVAIICPLISDVMGNTERSLEAAAITIKGAGEVLGLASTAAFGQWRDDACVSSVRTDDIQISADTEIPLILDGEAVALGNTLHITFVPESFSALVPGHAPD